MDTCSLEEGVMVKDILGITAAIVTLTVGIAFTFWAVPRPPPTIAAAQTAGVKPEVGEIAAVTVHAAGKARNPNMLPGVKAGDLVQLTYTRALAVALDKPAGR